jgi:hypothetical protein
MTKNYMLALLLTATIVPSAMAQLSEQRPTHLCHFERVLVPCVQLANPVKIGLVIRVHYRPLKWLPIWPNQSLFGGRLPECSYDAPNDNNCEKVYNRAEPYVSNRQTIETILFAEKTFSDDFVDTSIPFIRTWWNPQMEYFLSTTEVEKVFRGGETYARWLKAASLGVKCAKKIEESSASLPEGAWTPESGEPKWDGDCAFVQAAQSNDENRLRYCTFDHDSKTGIRSQVDCLTVAYERKGKRFILASRYVFYYVDGAGGETESFGCSVPGQSLAGTSRAIETFVRNYIGTSGKVDSRLIKPQYVSAEPTFNFIADGINIDAEKRSLGIFLRAYIKGGASEGGLAIDHAHFTISFQSSDNIIDYREPTVAMGNRIRNNFEARIKSTARNLSPGAHCETTTSP